MNYGRRLFQPQYRLELGRFLLRRLADRSDDRRKSEAARLQCARLAIGPAEAIETLGMPASAMRSFAKDHAERLSAARARVESAGNSRMGGGADIDFSAIDLNGVAFEQHSFDADAEAWDLNDVVLGAGVHTITLHGAVVKGPASYSGTLNIAAVPEPATWAMMIMGFGGMGAVLRRRKPATVSFS